MAPKAALRKATGSPANTTPRSPRSVTKEALGAINPPDDLSTVGTTAPGGSSPRGGASTSFSDLIRAREAQQRRLRETLEQQNRQLKEKLGLLTCVSPDRKPSEPSPPGASADLVALGVYELPGTSKAEAHEPNSSNTTNVSQSAMIEIINFVTDIKDTITKSQEAEQLALRTLENRFEKVVEGYESRISLLEAKLSAEERARDILREEQAEQFETLSTGVEELRQLGSQRLDERCTAIESTLSNHQLSIQALNANAEDVGERLADLETFQSESSQNAAALTVSLQQVSDAFAKDRSTLLAFKDETIYAQKEKLEAILNSATTQLEYVEKQLSKSQQHAQEIQTSLEDIINMRIGEAQASLRSDVASAAQASRDAMELLQAEWKKKYESLGTDVAIRASEARHSVDQCIAEVKERYNGVVEAKIREVVQEAKALEEERRREFPTADVDRIALMIEELEGAAVLLEGVTKNSIMPSAVSRPCPLTERVETLEALVDELSVKVQVDYAPRIMFSVDCQTGPLAHAELKPQEVLKTTVERHLQRELDMATAESSAAKVKVETLRALGTISPSAGNAAGRRADTKYDDQPRASPRELPSPRTTIVTGAASASSSDSTQRKHPHEILKQIAEEKERKEIAAEKVQQVLRAIQSKFQELSVREPLQRSMTLTNTPNSRKVTEQIAQQKEAVYQKERQLVEQRNKLWKEIADLEAQEERILQGAY